MTADVHRLSSIPAGTSSVGAFDRVDYADAHMATISNRQPRSPEAWARAVFEGAPSAVRAIVTAGWKFPLGLRLAPLTDPEHVLGWPIISSGDNWTLLEQHSRLLSARLVFWVDESQLIHSTFVRYDRAAARALWTPASFVHGLVIPYLLRRATA